VLSDEALAQAQKDETEKKQAEFRADSDAEVAARIAELRTLRANEEEKLAGVEKFFDVPTVWGVALSLPDQTDIQPALGNIRMGYEKWDDQIKALKDLYTKRGESPDLANQYRPNRARWNQLATRKE
jgi:hypothetical protein